MRKFIFIPLFLFFLLAFFSCPEPPDTHQVDSGNEYGSELNPGDTGKFTTLDVTLSTFTLQWISATDSPIPFEQLEYNVYKSDTSNISTAEEALTNGVQVGSTLSGFAKGVSMNLKITVLSKTDPPSYYTVVVSVPDGDSAVYNTYIYAMPLVKNLTLNFNNYDEETGRAGDFLFTQEINKTIINNIYDTQYSFNNMKLRPFHGFGDTLLSPEGNSASREMVFHPAEDAHIVSPINGVVTRIIAQDEYGGTVIDNEVFISPVEGSGWQISLDHIRNPLQVEVGDSVSAGNYIGKPSLEYEHDDSITDIGMSEFLVLSPDGRCWCPFALFDDDLADEYKAKVYTLMQDWENYIDDYDLTHDPDHAADQYDSTMWVYCSGCTDPYLDP